MQQEQTKQAVRENINHLVEKTHRRLLTIHTVFPFDFFPDTLHIDENKIDIIHRTFFIEKQMFPLLVKNINAVVLTTNLFFATLTIEVTGYERNPDPIRLLWHKDAVLAKRLIFGLITCAKEDIDTSKLNLPELRTKLEEIGKAREHNII